MTDVDEQLLTAAKLREQVQGAMDGDDRLLDHTGLLDHDDHRQVISFAETAVSNWDQSDLSHTTTSTLMTDSVSRAVVENNPSLLAYAVGVTEQSLQASQLTLLSDLNSQLVNNDAPAFITLAGNPNTGKTNTASLLVELRKELVDDDLMIISNLRSWELVDKTVTSAHDLLLTLLDHRDRPKAILLDEASTSFDSRTYRREIATQYTPMAKRYAKLNVDHELVIAHTGKDLHPERKRLTTLSLFKSAKQTAELYQDWPADADHPADRLYHADLTDLEATTSNYSPDDAAPWSWDLPTEVFALDLDWDDLYNELIDRGPVD
jgi:hypothetical protein